MGGPDVGHTLDLDVKYPIGAEQNRQKCQKSSWQGKPIPQDRPARDLVDPIAKAKEQRLADRDRDQQGGYGEAALGMASLMIFCII